MVNFKITSRNSLSGIEAAWLHLHSNHAYRITVATLTAVLAPYSTKSSFTSRMQTDKFMAASMK